MDKLVRGSLVTLYIENPASKTNRSQRARAFDPGVRFARSRLTPLPPRTAAVGGPQEPTTATLAPQGPLALLKKTSTKRLRRSAPSELTSAVQGATIDNRWTVVSGLLPCERSKASSLRSYRSFAAGAVAFDKENVFPSMGR